MIPASRKFPLRTEFISFRARASKFTTPHTILYHLSSDHSPRFAVIIPKKVSKHATTRNWLRRLTYDTLWPQAKDKNLDLVLVYKPLILAQSPATKTQIITELNSLIPNS